MALIDALLLDPYPFEIFVAYRLDGLKGSGTMNDPFDGSPKYGVPLDVYDLTNNEDVDALEATLTTSVAHNYSDGDVVTIAGVTAEGAPRWNGTFVVYDTGTPGVSTTFKYYMLGKPAADVDGVAVTATKVLAFRFDEILSGLAPTHVHLGPTPPGRPFLTRGYADGVSGGWSPKPAMVISGAGVDVTTLQLVPQDVAHAHFFAIGHPLVAGGVPNNLDFCEVAEMTIDANLVLKRSATVACGAIRLMGNHVKVHNVKAINWGSKSETTRCQVFAIITATADPDISETFNSGLANCIATQPYQHNRGEVALFHMGGKDNPTNKVQAYGSGSYIRESFADCAFPRINGSNVTYFSSAIITSQSGTGISGSTGTFVGKRAHNRLKGEYVRFRNPNDPNSKWNGYFRVSPDASDLLKLTADLSGSSGTTTDSSLVLMGTEFYGITLGSCKDAVIEQNELHNVWVGGPFQDSLNTRDIWVRGNFYKNVIAGPYFKLGSLGGQTGLSQLTHSGGVVTATSTVPHNLFVGAWVKIEGASPTGYNGVYQVTGVASATFQYSLGGSLGNSTTGSFRLVWGVHKALIEDNVIELTDFTSGEYAVPDFAVSGSWRPTAFVLGDDPATGSSYAHGDLVVRWNKVHYLDSRFDSAFSGIAAQIAGAKNLLSQNNIVECAPTNSLKNFRCGTVNYFNNKTPTGALIQGYNGVATTKYSELESEAEDALLLTLI